MDWENLCPNCFHAFEWLILVQVYKSYSNTVSVINIMGNKMKEKT